ncbi:MAG: hypothetical protein LBD52_04175 [Prevotellaceae bacterium]|nr:hypothetical protein [Prevotellaceae bacterium]
MDCTVARIPAMCSRTAMRLYLLLVTCFPAMLSAQNGVMVSGLDVNAGTVTFKVSWARNSPGMPSVWSDSVWVFVDYNNAAGAMKRLPLMLNAGATLTETSAPGVGKLVEVPGNNQGMWVIGNAKSASSGSFSATVKLFTAATVTGACAYASNYPPTGEYIDSGSIIHFTGTPPYDLVLKHTNGTTKSWISAGNYFVQPDYTLQSFIDKTGMPGTLKCAPMTGNINFECMPSSVPKGRPATFTVNLVPTVPQTSKITYSWSAPEFTPATYSGATFTTTAPNTFGAYEVTLTAYSRGFCDLTRKNGVTVLECTTPKVFTLTASAPSFCDGGAGVTFALSDTESGVKYQLYKDGVSIGTELSGGGSAATFSGAFNVAGLYTARSVQGGKYCEVAMTGSHGITSNLAPQAPQISANDVCLNSGNLVFTASGYSGAVEWLSDGGGVVNGNTVTFAGTLIGTKTVTARSAQTYANAPTCYSVEATQSATVNPLPTVSSTAGASRCGAGTVTLTATPSDGAVMDWHSASSGDALLLSSNNNYITPTINTSTTYYAQARIQATGCVSASRTAVLATVQTAPAAPNGLTADKTTICSGEATTVTLTATGGDTGSGAVYEWGTGAIGSNLLSPSTTTANTCLVNPSDAVTYWVRLKGTTSCSATTGGATTSIGTYGTIDAGVITTASKTTWIGMDANIVVENSSMASGANGSFTYLWLRTGTGGASTLTANDAVTGIINSDDYATAGTYYFNRYAKDAVCSMAAWIAATGTYTLVVREGVNQQQGGCTFTPPPVAGTFASFNKNYSASTYVTLADERDGNNYTVVKIADRWIMAQNLNYQKDLTLQENSKAPTTKSGGKILELIGHFWCPGGYSATSTTSTRASCDVWGALYSWETAMMVDGKWTSDAHNSSTWVEPTSYGTSSSSGNTQNHARSGDGATSGGRGICPPNWHVPTDKEWGDILNAMESGAGTTHNTGTGERGTDAGTRGKSKCKIANNSTSGNAYVNDANANWYYYSSRSGTDVYGFRVLPAGYRANNGSNFSYRGRRAYFWHSTAYNNLNAGFRYFSHDRATVNRNANFNRSYALSVRCIRDL